MKPVRDSMRAHDQSNRITGQLGESVAAMFLMKRGFSILERNFLRPFGEIDIIAREMGLMRFVEVKTVSYETLSDLEWSVSHETWRPEDRVDRRKYHQISKAVQAWVNENSYTGNVQIDVLAVRIVPRETFATVNWIENVSFE